MAHTTGPWAYDGDSQEVYGTAEKYGSGWIARVVGNDSDGRPFPDEERLANARLIAAAPELLAALRKAVAALEILDEDSDVAGWRNLDATYVDATIAGLLCHLEQCIAKAEGVTMEGTNGKERSLD
jgi:hypothetical protein